MYDVVDCNSAMNCVILLNIVNRFLTHNSVNGFKGMKTFKKALQQCLIEIR